MRNMRDLFQEKYEAWLNHCRRPEVWSQSRGEAFVSNEPFREIIRLGIPALPFLMEKLQESPIEGRLLHHALTAITKKKFHVQQQEIDGQLLWTVEEFPDIQPSRSQPDTNILWLRWWREKLGETSGQFEELYQEWKNQKVQEQGKTGETYRKMVDLGIVALPMMMAKVAGGEANLIPAISELTAGAIVEDAEVAECLAWWEREGEKWIIAPPETNGRTAPEDTAAARSLQKTP